MNLPLRTLPIIENWDCHHCGVCCRDSVIALDEADLARLAQQKWEAHPEFQGTRVVTREGTFGGRKVLAKRPDGSCVFLTEAGRCRIHELHGFDAKPAICRMFPLQLVPLEKYAFVVARRSCPSAAEDVGRPVKEHLPALNKMLTAEKLPSRAAPPILRGRQPDWAEFQTTADAIENLLCDERFPLVRRLVHASRFCTILEECLPPRMEREPFCAMVQVVKEAALEDAGEYFRDRQAPSAAAGALLRQAAAHYVRMHPQFAAPNSWCERLRLMWISTKFARGRGSVPAIHPNFPPATFAELERPLGALAPEVLRPLDRFFQTHAASRAYALLVGGERPLIECFRALVLTHPVAMWLLRWAIGSRVPEKVDMVSLVVSLERGQGMGALARGASMMARSGDLERLVAWYAR